MSIAWDPFTRRGLEFEEIPLKHELNADSCGGSVSDVLSAAEVLRDRLTRYLDGGSSSYIGLTTSSPSNYNNKIGLAEGNHSFVPV